MAIKSRITKFGGVFGAAAGIGALTNSLGWAVLIIGAAIVVALFVKWKS